MTTFHEIPQVDLATLHTKTGMYQVAEAIKEAYTTVGFAYIYNHGFPKDLLEATFKASADFHKLPLEEKMKIQQNKFFRGYMPIDSSIIKKSTLGVAKNPNQSEAFILAHEVTENDSDFKAQTNLAGPNQWPQVLPEFRKVVTEYNREMLALAKKMVQVFSIAFGLTPEGLDQYFTQPTTFLRLQYYPKQPNFIPEHQFGIAPHTDYGFLTVLAQDNKGGLQVKNPDGEWIDVPYIPDMFILNSSDMLKRMTNDTFISTPHRVINRSGDSRFSIPFFLEPSMHAQIQVIDTFISQDNPAKYTDIEYSEHLMQRIRNNYNIGA